MDIRAMTCQSSPAVPQQREIDAVTADPRRSARDLRAFTRLDVIACGITETSLGCFVLAASRRGLCAAHWLADRALAQRFATAAGWPLETAVEPSGGQAAAVCQPWFAAAHAMIEGTAHELRAPLDLQGTFFQISVWNALLATRHGERLSYSALALRLGRPDAVRAVASAVGANPLAVIVPCHRIVGADGQLTGYRWGLAGKATLLQREIVNAAPGCYISSP